MSSLRELIFKEKVFNSRESDDENVTDPVAFKVKFDAKMLLFVDDA